MTRYSHSGAIDPSANGSITTVCPGINQGTILLNPSFLQLLATDVLFSHHRPKTRVPCPIEIELYRNVHIVGV
jgi:hypothetical protein